VLDWVGIGIVIGHSFAPVISSQLAQSRLMTRPGDRTVAEPQKRLGWIFQKAPPGESRTLARVPAMPYQQPKETCREESHRSRWRSVPGQTVCDNLHLWTVDRFP